MFRGCLSTLFVLLLFYAQGQETLPPEILQTNITETAVETDAAEQSQSMEFPNGDGTALAGEQAEAVEGAPAIERVGLPVNYEPPPPQVIQVQLPTMPVLAREDIELLVGRLTAIEQRLVEQQTNTTAMVMRSNESILTFAAVLGGLGFLGMVGGAVILMRAFNRFSDIVLTLPLGQQLGRSVSLNALAMDDAQPSNSTALEQVSARFLGALEQLEKRVRELEVEPVAVKPALTTAAPGNGSHTANTNGALDDAGVGAEAEVVSVAANAVADNPVEQQRESGRRIIRCIEDGERLLQDDKYEEALGRFDEALAMDPRCAEALIKRGMALERLQRMDAAMESYDRAIATNDSLTLAYLHKGAICNRLQRYREALECYERALQAEQKGAAVDG